ncbi:MAG TPA: hypothetical protein VMW89_18605 [Desulfatiglandales bacterium]|nr:hypothetical protein [Desulfatiglandales bacterium]
MEAYTGRQRVSAAFKKTFTDQDISIDRSPAYPIMGQCNAQLMGASVLRRPLSATLRFGRRPFSLPRSLNWPPTA